MVLLVIYLHLKESNLIILMSYSIKIMEVAGFDEGWIKQLGAYACLLGRTPHCAKGLFPGR